ncbi:MAG: hypothetical protein ACYCSN_15425 [Acidobacteriaceae bacterium]
MDFGRWGVLAWLGFLVFVFLVVVYFRGFTQDTGASASALAKVIHQTQGGGQNYPTGG